MTHRKRLLKVARGEFVAVFDADFVPSAASGRKITVGVKITFQWRVMSFSLARVQTVRADGAALPFPDRTFDLIVSNLGVNNFSSPMATLGECSRVAKVSTSSTRRPPPASWSRLSTAW